MSDKNLLITIIDTNPIWWSLQSAGLIKSDSTSHSSSNANLSALASQNNFKFSDLLSAVVGFLNVYKTMDQQNAAVLLAAHNTKADYLYPSRSKAIEKYSSPWEKYENINDMDEQIKENVKKLFKADPNDEANLANDSMVTSAIGLALCYINRIQKKYTFADTVSYRLLIIKACDDSSNQYMNFMNMVFSAEKLNITIDSCVLNQDSSLLQQASNLTNGLYFKVPQINGLLNYLLWLFLPNLSTRSMLVYPPNSQVDFRAACFCHRKLIDVGYVCSVCLSVFCSFTPICSTCNCNFQYDVSMLKKASSLKQGQFSFNKLQSQTNNKNDEYNQTNLVSKFQDTSISSPMNIMSDSNSNTTDLISTTAAASVKLITANTTIQSKSRSNANFDDSFDMLE